MTEDQKALVNPAVVLREEFDDWAVIYNPVTAAASGINPVGVAIFKLLDGNHTLGQIVEAVRSDFSEVPENLEDEVHAFVEGLVAKGYAGYAGGASPS